MPQPPASEHPITPFTELQAVDSTNNYARGLVRDGLAVHGKAIFAYEQTAGKGQRGKEWVSEKGKNIMVSLLLNPSPLTVVQQFPFSAMIAVSVQQFFSNYAGDQVKIKWPNDLYWQDRKAGGLLVESIIGPDYTQEPVPGTAIPTWKWAIAGIGININQTAFDPNLPNPVSLKQITGKTFDVIALAKELAETVLQNFDLLIKIGPGDFLEKYNDRLYKKEQTVKLKKNNRVFESRIKSVSNEGKLITEHGIEEAFDFGEIQWLI